MIRIWRTWNHIFKRAERSLFAQWHVKMISFFSRRWHPSAFHLFKSNFFTIFWSNLYDFCINTTTVSQSIIFDIFSCRKIFFGDLLATKNSFFGFFRGQRVYLWFLFCRKIRKAHVFALIDGTPFRLAACCDIFCQKCFLAIFRRKKQKFPRFSKTDLLLPIAHCVSQLWRSIFTNVFVKTVCLLLSCTGTVVIDRCRNFLTSEFLVKIIENPDFFKKASVTLSHFLGLIFHVWHPNAS